MSFHSRNYYYYYYCCFLQGLNGALICSVNDDPSVVRSTPTSALAFNGNHLPSFESSRRAERLLPPMGFWNTSGVSKFDYHLLRLFFVKKKYILYSSRYRSLEN